MAWFFIYPTCDIHLLRTNGAPMELEINDSNGNSLPSADTTFSDFDSNLVTVTKVGDKIRFSPVADGVTIGRIQNTKGGEQYKILIRVSIHNSIQKLWFGNNKASIHEGEDNYLLSVFAQFNDNIIGDVTGHPYLNFNINTPAPLGNSVQLNNTNDKGRLKGITNTGTNTVSISVSHSALNDQLNVIVTEPLNQLRNIIESVRLNGVYSEKRNILILSEGFEDTVADRDMFSRTVREMDHNLFDTTQQTPYDIVKDSFNVWKAFIASSESGVTIGSPLAQDGRPIPSSPPKSMRSRICNISFFSPRKLIEFVGLPDKSPPADLASARTSWANKFGGIGFNPTKVDQQLFDFWLTQNYFGQAQAKDSFFGLIIGGRYSDRWPSEDPETTNSYFLSSAPARSCVPDRRRLAKYFLQRDHLFLKFISSLRLLSGSTTDPNKDVHKAWVQVQGTNNFDRGSDYTLICFLVKDNLYTGTNFGPLAFALGSDRSHPVQFISGGPKIDHTPNLTFTPGGTTGFIEISDKASTIAHEFGHSIKLLDEYEGYDDPSHTIFPDKQDLKDNLSARGWNLTHFYDMKQSSSNKLDAGKIPWNWHRVAKVAVSVKPAFNQGTSQIVIRMKPGEGANWQNEITNNTEIFLRHPEMNRDTNDRTKQIEGPLTINQITPNATDGDVFILDGRTRTITGNNPYPAGSIIFVPEKDFNGIILTTVDPAIVTFINSTSSGMGNGKPFVEKTNCNACNDDPGFPPNNIPNFNYPANRFMVIGLYEGGGTYNCKIYRSTGLCKMRSGKFEDAAGNTKRTEFSFIAKYIIVNQIDPTRLMLLNSHYPK
jgi:hypothetical protein